MPFRTEPTHAHGQAATIGILLCNLGTPDAPTAPALKRYLRQFLSDHRVVEIPKAIWWLILNGIILNVRPQKSASKYATVWTPDGSPLKVWTERQAQDLARVLGERGHVVAVRYAMRYGNPSIATQLDALKAAGATRILIVPAYPQYSGTTTASVCDAVYDWARHIRNIPEFRFIQRYHDDDGYVQALKTTIEAHWRQHGRPDQLVMSFHGVPERTLHLGDPYHCECHKTGRLLAEALGLSKSDYQVTFQSRFGKAKWLEPYTEPTLIKLGQSGTQRVDVVCPGFTSDCLETLEEINQEARTAFLSAGGTTFHYIPCLNADPAWIAAWAQLIEQHLGGWPSRTPPPDSAMQASRARAIAMGAPN
jgi:protoporphyrin/coproporphyrin ferrochelatase